jgi:PAS domain S-box-containing protein
MSKPVPTRRRVAVDAKRQAGLAARLDAERRKSRAAEAALKKLAAELLQRERLLMDALNHLPAGIAVFDAEDRLITCNRAFGDFHAELDLGRPGQTFSEMLRRTVAVIAPETVGADLEAWCQWRLAQHRNPVAPIEIYYRDGRWSRISEARTGDGGIVHIRTDITDLKRAEREAWRDRGLLQAIFEAVPASISVKDLDLRYIMVNPVMRDRMTDRPAPPLAEFIGRTASELFGPDAGGPSEALDREVIATGQPVPLFGHKMPHPSGGATVLLMTKTPVRDDRGELFGVLTVTLDVSGMRRVEEVARRVDERLTDFAETSSDWFWETGPDFCFTFISDGAWILGRDPGHMLGKTRWHPRPGVAPDEPQWLAHRADHEARRPYRDFTYRSVVGEGPARYISVSGKPVFGADGGFLGYRGSARDVTRQVTLERELTAAKEQAEAASRAKSDFLASMSHELRTPLNAIMGFAQVLMGELFGPIGQPRYRDYARDIHFSGAHLLDVINDVLDMAKIEVGRYELNLVELDLAEEVERCHAMVAESARTGELALRVEVPADLPRVTADRRALRQILLNLLSNAIKFTPVGGTVATGAAPAAGRRGAAMLRMTVSDTGIGIPPEQIPRLGRPFEQVAGVLERPQGGSGLGLALSRSLAEMHGGRLEIESQVGTGTVVTVWLPMNGRG